MLLRAPSISRAPRPASPERGPRRSLAESALSALGSLLLGRKQRESLQPRMQDIVIDWNQVDQRIPRPQHAAQLTPAQAKAALDRGESMAVVACALTPQQYAALDPEGNRLVCAGQNDQGEWGVGIGVGGLREQYPQPRNQQEVMYLGIPITERGVDFTFGYLHEMGCFISLPTHVSATLEPDVFETAFAGHGLRMQL